MPNTLTVEKSRGIKTLDGRVLVIKPAPKTDTVVSYPKSASKNDGDVFKKLLSDDTKAILFNLTKRVGISNYSHCLLKNDNTAIKQSQKHLIDLIKYYEGDRFHYYEAYTSPYKDKFGTSTNGFGHLSNKLTTQEGAYRDLSASLETAASELKNILEKKVGKGTYDSLPNSIKEGLIDLGYNKGSGKISSNKALLDAIKKKDYSKVVANLVYVYSGKSNAKKVAEPGLYKRSLSRAILASRDLTGKERTQTESEIKSIYNKAKKCYAERKENSIALDKIYEQYTKGSISSPAVSAESRRIKVGNNFKGKGMMAVARTAYQAFGDNPPIEWEKFYKEFRKYNRDADSVIIGGEVNVPYSDNMLNPVKTQPAASAVNSKPDSSSRKNPKKVMEESVPKAAVKAPKEEKGFFGKIFDGIKNFFKSIFGSKKEKKPVPYGIEEGDTRTAFQKMVQDGKIKKEKDISVISLDYEIQKGENLWRLSRNYDTTLDIICRDNNIKNPDIVQLGQKIKLRKFGYEVQKGDDINKIAKKFRLKAEIINDINNFDGSETLKSGDIIEIPGFKYKVQKGDSLMSIAKRLGVTAKDLLRINEFKNGKLTIGQELNVVYNNVDYASATEVKYDSKTNTFTEIVDVGNDRKLQNRPLLQKKYKVDGKVQATRAVFKPLCSVGPLAGKTIIVNAGHGYTSSGIADIGASSRGHDIDDEWLLNYDNAMKLKDKLCAKGATVIYLQGKVGLVQSEIMKKQNNADMFISVHVNSTVKDDGTTKDRTMIFYRDTNVSGAAKQNSIRFANIAKNNLNEWILKNEKVAKEDAYIEGSGKAAKRVCAGVSINEGRTGILKTPLNSQKIPGIIWEVAFITSPKGRERLKNKGLISNYADVMTNSVIEYFN